MRTQWTKAAAALLVAAAMCAPAAADVEVAKVGEIKLFIGTHTVGTAQALQQDDVVTAAGAELGDLEPGFQTAWGNLEVRATFGEDEDIEMFYDLYISSRPHPSTTYGHEGWLMVRGVPKNLTRLRALDRVFDHVDIKVGHYEIDFGDHTRRRSDNADVQNNALIGNFIIDPTNVEVGAEIISKPGTFNWLVGVSNGTNTEDFADERGTALHGKVWAELPQDLRVALSYYTVDHSGNATSKSNLFAGNRGGGRYGAILGGGSAPGEVLPTNGKNLDAYQLDLTWDGNPVELYANFGNTRDSDTNASAAGTPVEEWNYWTGEVVYHVTEHFYGAARYGTADAVQLRDLDSNGSVSRIQAGIGFWVTDQMLGKIEYVNEQFDGFRTGDIVSAVQAWRDPSFSGVVAEFSFSF